MSETFTVDEVRRHLADECTDAGGQHAWARLNRVSQCYVSQVLSGAREPGAVILSALGLRRVVLYADAKQAAREASDA